MTWNSRTAFKTKTKTSSKIPPCIRMGNYSLQLDQIRVFHKMCDSAQEEPLEQSAVETLTPSVFKRENKIYRSDLHFMRNQIIFSNFIFILS